MKRISSLLALTCLLVSGPSSAIGQDESISQLLKKIPAGANAVLVADMARARTSQVAQQNGWFKSDKGKIESGVGLLPANASQVVIASQTNLRTLGPNWVAGIFNTANPPSLESISQQTNGQIEKADDQQVVATDSDVYIFKMANQVYSYSPANRQMMAGWVIALKQKQQQKLSSYLESAVDSIGTEADLVIAYDLANAVSADAIYRRAKDSSALSKKGIDPMQFSRLMSSIQGITITVDCASAINAQAKIDFGTNVQSIAPFAKQLILEFLDNHGAHFDSFDKWQAKSNGNQIEFSGQLSQTGLRRLISMFDSPEPHMLAKAEPKDSKPESMAAATKTYYDTITSFLDELQKEIGSGGESSYKYSHWFRSYADKIDNLPIHGVDSEMLDFGTQISRSFRDMNLNLISTRQTVDVKNADLMAYGSGSPARRYRGYGRGYGGYGNGYGYGYRYGNGWASSQATVDSMQTNRERQSIHTKARANATDFVVQQLQTMRESANDMRRKMTEKYPDTF